MSPVFAPAIRPLATGMEGRRERWAAAWLGALAVAGRCVHGFLRARERQAERRRAELARIDDADLSEAGRQARREALHAIRDAQRRGGDSDRARR